MPINHKQHVKIFTKFTALVSYSFGPGMQIGDLDRHKNWDYQFALQYHSMVLVTQLAEQLFAKQDVYSLNPSTFKSLNTGSVKWNQGKNGPVVKHKMAAAASFSDYDLAK